MSHSRLTRQQTANVESNDSQDTAASPNQRPENDTTYFLLDITDDDEKEPDKSSKHSSQHSKESSTSSSSSVSAQVVIDHGSKIQPWVQKRRMRHLHGLEDDDSASDFSCAYPPEHSSVNTFSNEDEYTQHGEGASKTTLSGATDKNTKQPFTQSRHGLHQEPFKNRNLMYTDYDSQSTAQADDPRESVHQNHLTNETGSSPENAENAHASRKPVMRGKLNKRIQRILETNLHSHAWSRRESFKSNRDPGLSGDEALRKLLNSANLVLEEEKANIEQTQRAGIWITYPETILSLLCFIVLLGSYVAEYLESNPYQFRTTGTLVEAILILGMTCWNGFLYYREKRLTSHEVADRASTIIAALESSGMNAIQDTKIPFIPSMTVIKVIRDGVARMFPASLLVEGDVVEMLYGDVAPGRMKYIRRHCSDNESQQSSKDDTTVKTEGDKEDVPRQYYLTKDQTFKPSLFGIPPPPDLMDEYLRERGRFHFVLLETPLESSLRTALQHQRPATVFANEAKKVRNVFYRYITWAVLFISLVINWLRFGLHDVKLLHLPVTQMIELGFVLPALAVLPLLPLSLPTLWLLARSFGNAQLLILFEALQISKTEYEDDDEVDEFDAEAPPPTKDLELSPNAVWDRFCALLTKRDRLSLTRSTNLLESLGSTTVICCLDREGTIANPFPTVEQLLFPNCYDDVNHIEVEEDTDTAFGYTMDNEEREDYLSSLKPIGLNFMLNTNCGVIQGHKRSEFHRRRTRLHSYGKTSPARQTCLCRLGKTIGFRGDALQSFMLRAEIYTFAPYHDVLDTYRYKSSRYFQFEVPNALSTVFEENGTGSYQLLTDGHPALILDKCSDYWDGRSLKTMNKHMLKKINDYYQNALVHDMQCIAFAYRPINTFDNRRIPFLSLSNDQEPGCAFVVLPFKSPSSGSSSSTSSSSSSSSLSSLSEADESLTEEDSGKSGTVKLRRRQRRPTIDTVETTSSDSSSDSDGRASDYFFEADEPVDEEEEVTFYKEVVKGQIFLGMASMCHQPKQNVVDFIEDLGLAGIRFVYFSPTAERESKAFAERLGLETDWNSCILLSSPNDGHCGNGYLQTHDIKAQLPRGIDQIRPHLENVDDIPLHVSLFAECTPRAMKEMIKIFQEYGEVVCCIGNALNTKNTELFMLSDIGIAMEPMHTRVQNKGRLSLQGRQLPLAVGASLVSLPCGLFMQYETSLYAVTQLIRDARRLMTSVRMGFAFYASACMSITLIELLSYCMLLPPVLTGYQILWLTLIILPLLKMSMLFTPHEDNIMLLMPGKNIEHVTDLWRFMLYYILRFCLLILMSIVIYVLTLLYMSGASVSQVFGGFGQQGWLHWSTEEQWAILYAQNFMCIVFVWYIAWVSGSFLHRTHSILGFAPYRNSVWVGAFFSSIILQFCFCAVSLAHGPFPLAKAPWFVYFIGFIWPLVLVPVQELVKMHDDKEFTRFQKRSKLEFSTKLGMHSPL